jgi:hypothetical protein
MLVSVEARESESGRRRLIRTRTYKIGPANESGQRLAAYVRS